MAVNTGTQNPTAQDVRQEDFLANIRVPVKLNLMIAVMAIGIVVIFFAMQSVISIQNEQRIDFMYIGAPIAALNDADIALGELQAELKLLDNSTLSAEEKTVHLEKIANTENVIATTLQKYKTDWLAPVDLTLSANLLPTKKTEIQQTLNELDKNESVLWAQFEVIYGAYRTESTIFYQDLKNSKYDAKAHARIDSSLSAIQALVKQLIAIHTQRLQMADEIAQTNYPVTLLWMRITLGLVILFGFLLASSIARSITSRLVDLGNNASAFEYDLLDRRTATISVAGNDEIAAVSRSFDIVFQRLRKTLSDLEVKVKERTASLTSITAESNKRAQQFQAVTQITQKIASERDLDALLSTIADIIGSQFEYQQVAIYLNDDLQEYTILSAASSAEGKQLLALGYKLAIKENNLICYVAKNGSPRTNTDGDEAAYSTNPNFSSARSEFALPLKAGTNVIGVLDVQSDKENAFDKTDIEALTALANQITIAIQNARLFNETQTALAESQLLYGTVVKQAWETNMRTNPQVGYRYAGVKAVPLDKPLNTPEMIEALESGYMAVTHPSKRKNENALAIPLKLRNKTIGVINIKMPVDVELAEDETDIVSAAAQRISLALESASLLEESQRRAMREQNISEMSARIGTGTDIETILQTAIRELGNQISGAQIMIEVGSEEDEQYL